MDTFLFLFGIAGLLFLSIGSVLGWFAFFKARQLSRNFAQTHLQLSQMLVERELAEKGAQKPETPEVVNPKPARQVAKKNDSGDEKLQSELPVEPQETIERQETKETKPEPKRNFEEKIGSLWAVWVGGLALALGAVFLVKYSIERGLLSPGVRVALGMVFSIALVAIGEWSRRRGERFSFAGFSKANIPAILTGAGSLGLFASTYAAYALYDMISPLVSFLALGAVALATTVAALLHGPLLAALGILAAFGVPFLVTTDTPSVLALGIYILGVSVASFAVARLRLWRWLALATGIGMSLYGGLILLAANSTDWLYGSLYLGAAWVLVAYVFFISLYEKLTSALEKIDKAATGLLGVLLFGILIAAMRFEGAMLSVVLLVAIIVGPFVLGYFYSAARAIIYPAIIFLVIGYLVWKMNLSAIPDFTGPSDVDTLLTSFRIRNELSHFAALGVLLAAIGLLISLYAQRFSPSRTALAIGGAMLAPMLLAANYLRVAEFSASLSFAFASFLVFSVFLYLSHAIVIRLGEQVEGRLASSAAYSVGAFVSLALSFSFVLEEAALTIALALLVPAIAFTYHRTRLSALRALSALASLLWLARILWEPSIISGDIGTTPVFNWLTYGYGIPCAGFIFSAWLLMKGGRDRWLEALEALAVASMVATLGLVGLHALDPAEVFTTINTLEEVALIAIIGGGVALGLLNLRRTVTSLVLNRAVTLLGYAGIASAAYGLLIVYNPWVTGASFGSGLILNGLLLAYVFPGLLYLALGWRAHNNRSKTYVIGALALGALLLAFWVNLSIRHFYQPDSIQFGRTGSSELYSYSVIWLIIGITVLSAGIYFRNKTIRLISVGILMLVVAKVFLIDMAGLQGILRALSFIGLGATLIGIGLVYQRVLSQPEFDEPR